jgi:hypothetical protein
VTCAATVDGTEFSIRVRNATDALTAEDLPRIFDRSRLFIFPSSMRR